MGRPKLPLLYNNNTEGDLQDDSGEEQSATIKVVYCFDHWTCLLNAVLLNNNSNSMAN